MSNDSRPPDTVFDPGEDPVPSVTPDHFGAKGGDVVFVCQATEVVEQDERGVPDLRIRGGIGWGEGPGGSIVFELPNGTEFLRLDADGAVYVEGRKADSDLAFYLGLKRWLATAATEE